MNIVFDFSEEKHDLFGSPDHLWEDSPRFNFDFLDDCRLPKFDDYKEDELANKLYASLKEPVHEVNYQEPLAIPQIAIQPIEEKVKEATEEDTPLKVDPTNELKMSLIIESDPGMPPTCMESPLKSDTSSQKKQTKAKGKGKKSGRRQSGRVLALRADVMNKNVFRALRRE